MASIIEQLDLGLCQKILLRTEEVMGRNRPKSPANYEFEGYGPNRTNPLPSLHNRNLKNHKSLDT